MCIYFTECAYCLISQNYNSSQKDLLNFVKSNQIWIIITLDLAPNRIPSGARSIGKV